jgi:hypothetical protein
MKFSDSDKIYRSFKFFLKDGFIRVGESDNFESSENDVLFF